jgi:parvulin-like peptidyl-prolyl isomerase
MSDVVGRIQGKPVTRGEVWDYAEARTRAEGGKPYSGDEGTRSALKDLALIRCLASEYRQTTRPAQFEDAIATRLRRYLVHSVVAQFDQESTVTVEEMRAYYDAHPDNFQAPEARNVRHIFKEVREGASSDERAAVRKKMEDIRGRLLKGESFDTLARAESEQESGEKGGSIGWITSSTLKMQVFTDMAFGLEKGKISPLLETPYGFHIILVEDIRPRHKVPFETVLQRRRLETNLAAFKKEQAKAAYVQGLLRSARITTGVLSATTASQTLLTINDRPFSFGDYLLYEKAVLKPHWKDVFSTAVVVSNDDCAQAMLDELIYADALRGRIGEEQARKGRQLIEDVYLLEEWLKANAVEQAALTEESIRNIHEKELPRFRTEEAFELSIITMDARADENASQAEKKLAMDRARNRAKEAWEKLDAGMSFPEAARQFSDDPDAKRTGGYLGVLEYGQGGAILDETARKLSEGHFSKPVETRKGYFIAYLARKIPPRQKTLDESRRAIVTTTLSEAQIRLEEHLVSDLKAGKQLEVFEDRI